MKRLVASTEETKFAAFQTNLNQIVPNTSVGSIGLAQQIWVPTSQGVRSNNRIGERITPKSLRTQFRFFYDSAFTTTADVMIDLYIMTSKKCKSQQSVLADPDIIAGNFLDQGIGAAATFWDVVNPYTSASQRVDPSTLTLLKKKTFRLIRNVGAENLDATAGNAPNMTKSYASYSYSFKKIPKLIYDGNTTYPSNFAPFYLAVAYKSDGSSTLTNANSPNMSVYSTMTFKDS